MTTNEQGNGHSRGEWVIALVAGRTFVGKLIADVNGDVLSPVYEFQSGLIQNQNGEVGLAMAALPVLGLTSLKKLAVVSGAGATIIPLASLDKDEQSSVMRAVDKGEKITQSLRAAKSGVLVAGAGTKLPPMPGAAGR
jgi:hypothetical protein